MFGYGYNRTLAQKVVTLSFPKLPEIDLSIPTNEWLSLTPQNVEDRTSFATVRALQARITARQEISKIDRPGQGNMNGFVSLSTPQALKLLAYETLRKGFESVAEFSHFLATETHSAKLLNLSGVEKISWVANAIAALGVKVPHEFIAPSIILPIVPQPFRRIRLAVNSP